MFLLFAPVYSQKLKLKDGMPSSSRDVSCRTRKTRLCTVNVRSHRHVFEVFGFRFNGRAKNHRLIAPFSKIHDTPTASLFPSASLDRIFSLVSAIEQDRTLLCLFVFVRDPWRCSFCVLTFAIV